MAIAEEWKVYALGERRVVYVRAGRGELLRGHLGSRGFQAQVVPAAGFDRLELERHANVEAAQAALDDFPHRPAPVRSARGRTMPQTKTRHEREKELQALMRTPEGRGELERLADGYRSGGGRVRPDRTSVITYILVHERERGLIAD